MNEPEFNTLTTRLIQSPEEVGGDGPQSFVDFVVDGESLFELMRAQGRSDVSPFGWSGRGNEIAAIERLLGRRPPDLGDRVSLLVCPLCADLGCGALGARVVVRATTVEWCDFAYDTNYSPATGDEPIPVELGPFRFQRTEYQYVIRGLRPLKGGRP